MRRMMMLMLRCLGRRAGGWRARAAARSLPSRELLQEETGESLRLLPLVLEIFRERPRSEGPRAGVRTRDDRRYGHLGRLGRAWRRGAARRRRAAHRLRGGHGLEGCRLGEEPRLHLVGEIAEDAGVPGGVCSELLQLDHALHLVEEPVRILL